MISNMKIFINSCETVVKYIDHTSTVTALYKLTTLDVKIFLSFLKEHHIDMVNCIGYEVLFSHFLKNIKQYKYINQIGLNGYISVSGDFYIG